VAQKVEVLFLDDLDGGPAAETITFSLNGVNYEVDLSEENAEAFRGALAPYVEVARRLGRGKVVTRRSATGLNSYKKVSADSKTIRAWAASQPDIQLAPRGRIPQQVIERFEREHG
jgi:hypothetical protein